MSLGLDRLSRARAVASGMLALGGGLWLVTNERDRVVLIPFAFLVLAAVAIHVPTLGAQLFARASWWANLGLGAILCTLGGSGERSQGVLIAAANAAALLVIGRSGLAAAEERAGYAAVGHRGSLLLLMVLALADCQTLLLMGAAELFHQRGGGFLLGIAAVLAVGFVGLYRLALWGILVNVTVSFVAIVVTGTKLVTVDEDFVPVVLVLAAVQIVAAAPILLARVRGRAILPPLPPSARSIVAVGMVLSVLLSSVIAAAVR